MLTSGLFGYITDYLFWWLLLFSLVVHTWCFFKLFPKDRPRRSGLIIGNILVFACLAGVAMMAGETYLRFSCVETDSFGLSLPARRWFVYHTSLNSLGCRDAEWSVEKRPGVRRIAFVGDSFTYGWGIERVEHRFPDLVGSALREKRDGEYEILNVAKPGWGTGGQIEPVRDLATRFDVDEIVFCYVANDIEKLLPQKAGFSPTRPSLPTIFDLDRSCLLEFAYWRLYVPRLAAMSGYFDWLAQGYGDESTWRAQQRLLYEIIALCQDHGVELRVALLPFIRARGDKYDVKRIHGLLREYFEANGVAVADLQPAIENREPAELVVSSADPHPNELAHRLFAEAIMEGFYAKAGR